MRPVNIGDPVAPIPVFPLPVLGGCFRPVNILDGLQRGRSRPASLDHSARLSLLDGLGDFQEHPVAITVNRNHRQDAAVVKLQAAWSHKRFGGKRCFPHAIPAWLGCPAFLNFPPEGLLEPRLGVLATRVELQDLRLHPLGSLARQVVEGRVNHISQHHAPGIGVVILVAILARRSAVTHGRLEILLVNLGEFQRRLRPELIPRPTPVKITAGVGATRRQAFPRQVHHRTDCHRKRTDAAGIHQQILRGPFSDITAKLRINALDGHHFRQLVGAAVHHRHVVIGALAGSNVPFVLEITVAAVSPHRTHLWRNHQITRLNKPGTLLPQVRHKLRVGMNGAHNAHLVGNRLADEMSKSLVVALNAGVERSVTPIRQAPQTHRPEDFLPGRVFADSIPPSLLQDFRMGGKVIRHTLRPPGHIHAQRNGMVLRDDQTPLTRQFDLRLVRKNPGSRRHHVAFEAKDGFKNLVPHFERDSRVVLPAARRPARQQIFIVDKKPAVLKQRRGELLVQRGRQLDLGAARGLMVGPVIQRVHTQIFLRKLIDGVEGAAQVSPRQQDNVRGMFRLPFDTSDRN